MVQHKLYEEDIKNNELNRCELPKNLNSNVIKSDNKILIKFDDCTNFKELVQVKSQLLKNNDKNESKKKAIKDEFNKHFKQLFYKNYNKLLEEYNNNDIKLDTDKSYEILSNFVFNKDDQELFSCDEKDIKQFITLQDAVKNVLENKTISITDLTKENIEKFLQIISKLTNNQLRNASRLYDQIRLLLSGEIKSINKLSQTNDYHTQLHYLLSDYNNNVNYGASDYFLVDINRELMYACLNNYLTSGMNIEEYIKKFTNDKDNIVKNYIENNYKHRINKIYDEKINKETDKWWINTYNNEKNEHLHKLDNSKIKQWNWNTIFNKLGTGKYLESFNTFVNAIVKLYK